MSSESDAELGHADLRAVFEAPTIAQLAERIQSLRWALEGGDDDADGFSADDVEEIVL